MNKKIGVLTSSRADFGIYKPLLDLIKKTSIDLTIIVFGTHLQKNHGYTINEIRKDNFKNIVKIKGMPDLDSKLEISKGYSKLISNFAKFWNDNKFDYVFALGDRFEMSAAVQAGIPFQVKIAHIHGGETTLGAIDNIYRHQISLLSSIHFCSTLKYQKRIKNLIDDSNHVYNVGSLSLNDFEKNKIKNWNNVRKLFNIPNQKFCLVTFHPETINPENNFKYVEIIKKVLMELSKIIHIVITQANADTFGSIYRRMALHLEENNPKDFSVINSFGKESYFSAMKNCEFMLGNTSSGIIESASFGKYFINVGKRQSGRLFNKNTINVDYNYDKIISESKSIINKTYYGDNYYYKKNTAKKILKILLKEL